MNPKPMNLVRFNAILTWLIANLVIGFMGAVPLLSGLPLAAILWGSSPEPGGDFAVAASIFLIGTSAFTAIAVFANRALRRQLATTQRLAVAFWPVTLVVLLSPTVWFLLTRP
jgi:hypothetical protein